jgi:pimeloyl-ACP methyl ester carboxylesterase
MSEVINLRPHAQHGGAVSPRGATVHKLRGESAHHAERAREPLVLLHPFALCARVWRPVASTLREHHDVYTLTIPGHLGSDPLPPSYPHTIEAAVDSLEEELDAFGLERAHVVGCSLGGWLAIELARRGRALSVVALAPGGGWELGSREQQRLHRHFKLTSTLLRYGGALAMQLARFPVARSTFLRDAVARPERLTPEDARLLIESVWRCAVYEDVLRALNTQAPALPFATLPCPVKLVWGAKDRLLPMGGYSERWRRILPGAEWVVLPDVGHLQMYDDPEAVSAQILELTLRQAQTKLTG